MPETSGPTGRTPETDVIDFRAAEQLLAALDPNPEYLQQARFDS